MVLKEKPFDNENQPLLVSPQINKKITATCSQQKRNKYEWAIQTKHRPNEAP